MWSAIFFDTVDWFDGSPLPIVGLGDGREVQTHNRKGDVAFGGEGHREGEVTAGDERDGELDWAGEAAAS